MKIRFDLKYFLGLVVVSLIIYVIGILQGVGPPLENWAYYLVILLPMSIGVSFIFTIILTPLFDFITGREKEERGKK